MRKIPKYIFIQIAIIFTLILIACTPRGNSELKKSINSHNSISDAQLEYLIEQNIDVDFKTLVIGSDIQFSYPPDKLKLQSKEISQLIDSVRKYQHIPAQKKVALVSATNKNYVNVLLQVDRGNRGDFVPSNFSKAELTPQDIEEVKQIFLEREKRTFEEYNVKIKKWYPIKIEEINGCFCIRLEYIRESLLGDDVHVWLTYFPDDDKQFALSTSCRINDVQNWQSIFSGIISSVKII